MTPAKSCSAACARSTACPSTPRAAVTAVCEFARHRLRRAAYVGVPRAVVEQMMQQEAMCVRLHGQPAAEPPYADFFTYSSYTGLVSLYP